MAVTVFTVNGTDYEIDTDPTTFTAGELGTIEKFTGLNVTEFGKRLENTHELSALAWASLVWIALRRTGSYEPFDLFLDRIRMVDLFAIIKSMRAKPEPKPAPLVASPLVNPLGVPLTKTPQLIIPTRPVRDMPQA